MPPKKTLPEKPVKKSPVEPMLDWTEVQKYIDAKYEIDVRDYAKKFKGKYTANKEKVPYQDFWQAWILQNNDMIGNPSMAYIPLESDTPWIQEILELLKKEFVGKDDDQETLAVWVSW